jgi:hypothetical protein
MEDNSFVKRQRKDGHAGDKMTKPSSVKNVSER